MFSLSFRIDANHSVYSKSLFTIEFYTISTYFISQIKSQFWKISINCKLKVILIKTQKKKYCFVQHFLSPHDAESTDKKRKYYILTFGMILASTHVWCLVKPHVFLISYNPSHFRCVNQNVKYLIGANVPLTHRYK